MDVMQGDVILGVAGGARLPQIESTAHTRAGGWGKRRAGAQRNQASDVIKSLEDMRPVQGTPS